MGTRLSVRGTLQDRPRTRCGRQSNGHGVRRRQCVPVRTFQERVATHLDVFATDLELVVALELIARRVRPRANAARRWSIALVGSDLDASSGRKAARSTDMLVGRWIKKVRDAHLAVLVPKGQLRAVEDQNLRARYLHELCDPQEPYQPRSSAQSSRPACGQYLNETRRPAQVTHAVPTRRDRCSSQLFVPFSDTRSPAEGRLTSPSSCSSAPAARAT